MVGSLVQTLSFFWCFLAKFVFNLQLDEKEKKLFEQSLLPIAYLEIVEERCSEREREQEERTRKKLESALWTRDGPMLEEERLEELQRRARECAELFQIGHETGGVRRK
jgi:hypothetical protein